LDVGVKELPVYACTGGRGDVFREAEREEIRRVPSGRVRVGGRGVGLTAMDKEVWIVSREKDCGVAPSGRRGEERISGVLMRSGLKRLTLRVYRPRATVSMTRRIWRWRCMAKMGRPSRGLKDYRPMVSA
jgi:hypothetical protein